MVLGVGPGLTEIDGTVSPWPQGTLSRGGGWQVGGLIILVQCGQCGIETSPHCWGTTGLRDSLIEEGIDPELCGLSGTWEV